MLLLTRIKFAYIFNDVDCRKNRNHEFIIWIPLLTCINSKYRYFVFGFSVERAVIYFLVYGHDAWRLLRSELVIGFESNLFHKFVRFDNENYVKTLTMLSQTSTEALLSATYVENYLDCVENLPNDLQRHLSRLRELDVTYRGNSCNFNYSFSYLSFYMYFIAVQTQYNSSKTPEISVLTFVICLVMHACIAA